MESIDHNTAAELESHLRDAIEAEIEDGTTPEEAFQKATASLGDSDQLDPEFHKVHGSVSWAKRLLWMAAGFTVIKLIFLLISIGARNIEALYLRWAPGVLVKLPRPITFDNTGFYPHLSGQVAEQAHIAVFAKSVFVLVASVLFILISIRCIRGRSTLFNWWFADATPWKLISLTAIIPLLTTRPLLSLLWGILPKDLFNPRNLSDIDLYGMTENTHHALIAHTGSVLSNILAPVWIGLTIWTIVVTRRQGNHRFVSWMLGGHLVAAALLKLLSVSGMLSASAVIHFASGFAQMKLELFPSTVFQSNYGAPAASLLTQLLVAASVLMFAWFISRARSVEKLERLCRFLSRNAIPIVLIFMVPPTIISIIRPLDPESSKQLASWIYLGLTDQGVVGGQALQSSVIHPHFIEPWLILGIVALAGHTLHRERLGKGKILDRVAARLGLPSA